MKNINQLLHECLDRIDAKAQKQANAEAHRKGIAEARRILSEENKEKAA